MPDLYFRVESANPVPLAAQPLIGFKLHISNLPPGETIHTVNLRAQIQIEAPRRQYSAAEKGLLLDLFGAPDRWGKTLRNFLWTHVSTVVTSFTDSTVAELHAPCTFDFNVAATKYFHAVSTGDIPMLLLFSGAVFYANAEGALQAAPISWNKEARFRLPARVWREMMDLYYPNSAWLNLRRDVFERLYRYKIDRSLPTWEDTLESLLAAQEEVIPQ
ncbi:MAG: hypothetical protein JO340_07735 [Acidobacteriaceae bacterium]|nr:hypothetical protein [Acidobacteriaceae bacterium]